jgi:hypothetical protein
VPDAHAFPDDIASLKRLVHALQLQIERLKMQLARERRARFGRSSEQTQFALSQLQLTLESLAATTQPEATPPAAVPSARRLRRCPYRDEPFAGRSPTIFHARRSNMSRQA